MVMANSTTANTSTVCTFGGNYPIMDRVKGLLNGKGNETNWIVIFVGEKS